MGYFKLKDENSIFHDAGQNFTLAKPNTVGIAKKTQIVAAAVKGGAIEELKSEKDYKEAVKARGEKEQIEGKNGIGIDADSDEAKALAKDKADAKDDTADGATGKAAASGGGKATATK